MKKVLLLLLVILTITSNAQKKNRDNEISKTKTLSLKADSLENETKILHKKYSILLEKLNENRSDFSKKITPLLRENKELKDKIQKIEVQIAKHESKEDYYTSNLDFYTVWFGLIITIITLATGFITWSKFRQEINTYNDTTEKMVNENIDFFSNELRRHAKNFERKLKSVDKIASKQLESMANINTTISYLHFQENHEIDGIHFQLTGIVYSIEYYLTLKQENRLPEKETSFYKNLKLISTKLDDLKDNFSKDLKEALKDNIKKIMSSLNKIESKQLIDSKNLIAKVRLDINELVEQTDIEI